MMRPPVGSHAASAQPEPWIDVGRLGHVALEPLEAAEVVLDLLGDVAGRLTAAVGRQVRPEQRVQHVAGQVEGQVLLQLGERGEVLLLPSGRQLLERRVRPLHVRGVVLVVVQLHDLAADVGFERAVVVAEVGQGVDLLSHVTSWLVRATGDRAR